MSYRMTYLNLTTEVFIYQKLLMTSMALIPLAIQQGMSFTSFVALTLKTNPLGMLAIFTITDLGIRNYLKRNQKIIRSNLATTLITGPYLIEWGQSAYYYLNDKIVDLSDDFFNYTSALGLS